MYIYHNPMDSWLESMPHIAQLCFLHTPLSYLLLGFE